MRELWRFSPGLGICGRASAVGHAESCGPFGACFDFHDAQDRFGARTWETAEAALGQVVLNLALKRAGMSHKEIDLLLAGDLQNQCVASSQGMAAFGIPYVGIYGACSTFVEGLLMAGLALSAPGGVERAAVLATSHNCAAERQFRLPLEYGGQRTPTAQWTATAGGCLLLGRAPRPVCLCAGLCGRMVDAGIRDAANMGAAMAPAAADTLLRYFSLSGEKPEEIDAVITGDLGREGSAILHEILAARHLFLGTRHQDCGAMLYDLSTQDAHAGGSGCGCIAAMSAAHVLPQLESGKWRRVLLVATGALMSPSSLQQGGSIIGIAHLAVLERTAAP